MSYRKFKPGRGRNLRRTPGKMNGWEKRYAAVLDYQISEGSITGYMFDAMKLRLAEKTFYEIDFLVQNADLSLEVHEVKGHWEDDARVKIKVAASMFPFRFKAISWCKKSGNWDEEVFAGGE